MFYNVGDCLVSEARYNLASTCGHYNGNGTSPPRGLQFSNVSGVTVWVTWLVVHKIISDNVGVNFCDVLNGAVRDYSAQSQSACL